MSKLNYDVDNANLQLNSSTNNNPPGQPTSNGDERPMTEDYKPTKTQPKK